MHRVHAFRLSIGKKWASSQAICTQRHVALSAFTLAEVLITLGIIGIVAALTLPTVVQSYKKKVVETRMTKFYATFNEAIKRSEVVNGSYMDWDFNVPEEDPNAVMAWQDKYLSPYIKTLKKEVVSLGGRGKWYRVANWLPDGSLVLTCPYTTWFFFPNAKDFEISCQKYCYTDYEAAGQKWFTFTFLPQHSLYYKKALEPWTNSNAVSSEAIINDTTQGCKVNRPEGGERALCAKLIQINGWKIPDNYPFKF